jgi:hypothetical protein
MLVRAVCGDFIKKDFLNIQGQLFHTTSIEYRYLTEKRHLRDKHHGDTSVRRIADAQRKAPSSGTITLPTTFLPQR